MLCRNPARRKDPDDKDRRFWLTRFSDQEICEMAIGIANVGDDRYDESLAEICGWRATLFPSQNGKAA